MYAGLKLFGGWLLVRKAEIHNQVFPVYAGLGGNVLALDTFVADVGGFIGLKNLAHQYIQIFGGYLRR